MLKNISCALAVCGGVGVVCVKCVVCLIRSRAQIRPTIVSNRAASFV